MDPVLTQIIITGLATTVSALAVTIFRMQNQIIQELKNRIKEQDERDRQRIEMQAKTTTTLQAVVDVGMERLRAQSQAEQKP